MKPCLSNLTGMKTSLEKLLIITTPLGFSLGGARTDEHAYLDKELDEQAKIPSYYLRIPIHRLPESTGKGIDDPKGKVEIQQPFVLHHEYQTTNDPTVTSGLSTALVNQFRTPAVADAFPIERHWVEKAGKILEKLERDWLIRV